MKFWPVTCKKISKLFSCLSILFCLSSSVKLAPGSSLPKASVCKPLLALIVHIHGWHHTVQNISCAGLDFCLWYEDGCNKKENKSNVINDQSLEDSLLFYISNTHQKYIGVWVKTKINILYPRCKFDIYYTAYQKLFGCRIIMKSCWLLQAWYSTEATQANAFMHPGHFCGSVVAERLRAPNSNSGVSDQQSVGSNPQPWHLCP